MKIVVLDGYTLNPGDLDWASLEELGNLVVYDRTEQKLEEILNRIGDAEIVLTNKVLLTKETLDKAPNLKYIGVTATGYNVVDTEYAKKKNIIVTNVPTYSTQSVAQFTMGLLLEMCHHIGKHNEEVKNGVWSKSQDFCFWNSPLIELQGKIIGIVGFGKIGQATSKLAQAFGLKVLVYSRTVKPELESETCRFVSLNELLGSSDIISLHCPLLDSTNGIICASNISKMKEGVMIINTSRGGLVVEKDLSQALNSGNVYAAAVDVVSEEPIKESNPLLNAENCIITPHIAWAPKEARTRLMNVSIDNIKAFISENPINVVN
jgi:glycerate dehydrogenase